MASLMEQQEQVGSDDKVIRHVLIVIAMEAEAAPFIKAQEMRRVENECKHAPCMMYSSDHSSGHVVSLVLNGKCSQHGVDNVGTVPAALSTFVAINQLKPDLIVNAGTCGGFGSKGSAICDAYITTHTKNHDRRIPIPGFEAYGVGSLASLPCPKMVSELGLKTGVVTTANSLDHTEKDDQMMAANGIFFVCYSNSVSYLPCCP
jgi:5'-methylthioadenosine nucleosidase